MRVISNNSNNIGHGSHGRRANVSHTGNGVELPDITRLAEAATITRRNLLQAGLGLAGLPLAGLPLASTGAQAQTSSLISFAALAPSLADELRVPPGYVAQVLLRWGDPVGHPSGSPAFKPDASNSAAEQALQAGMHHDGMSYFSFAGADGAAGASDHGVLALNHEYTDEALLHTSGGREWGAEQALKSMQAVGVSVVEVLREGNEWKLVRPSRYARRITLATPCRISGPAAAHALLKTAQDPHGTTVLGTMMNCANGWTPWGTYLTCEENFQAYFGATAKLDATPMQQRYGIGQASYPHFRVDARFDLSKAPNEANRFGWVVEIDPFDPAAPPVKRTAMGRFKHEAAVPHTGSDKRVAFYMSDDEPFEYLYKFVCAQMVQTGVQSGVQPGTQPRVQPGGAAANRNMLDEGTLYVARFDENGCGSWLPLVHGAGPLTAANGFPDQATVLINARRAADLLGATTMDCPEGCAVQPATHDIFIACTNNSARGRPGAKEGGNPANPRVSNFFGHILRLREDANAAGAIRFRWNFFALAGDATLSEPQFKGNIKGDAFGSPDNLYLDARGVLWIQTDMSASLIGKPPYANLGNNQVLAADPQTGEVRRFLTVPRGAEASGCVLTPDAKTMFLNVQHPGETQPSTWPDGVAGGRPRSATVVVRRIDGGVIGT